MAQPFPQREEELLQRWADQRIFEQTLAKDAPKGDFVFYDGPPFATGSPHYGHLVGSIIKDVVPRFATMRGYRVERRWGWDCHGLPIENLVEKELGFTSKKDIEAYGIAKFNEACRARVLAFADEWKKTITRFGRWADMDNPYRTMDKDFMESVWWTFKQLWDKGLIYQDYKTMHVCPRCETTLSQQEVSEGYKDVKDLSVTVKFKLEPGQSIGDWTTTDTTYLLAWTTTPWTLPGNVALAVGADIEYVEVTTAEHESLIIAKNRSSLVEGSVGKVWKGLDLVGLSYQPPFGYYTQDASLKNYENGWKVYAADFVSADEGTGIAHEAPAFGADDWALLQKYNLPFIQHVSLDGRFKPEVADFVGLSVKPIEDPQSTDVAIIKYLAGKGLLFVKEKIEHSYPHCWRCDSPLINYATSSWFVKVTAVKERAIELASDINWAPAHIKEGRFGQWLAGARDWSISRQRFWASCMPIWQDDVSKEYVVIGSVAELEQLSGKKVDDLHKHIIDDITWINEKTGGTMRRIPDVLDTWFDSGSMPYAQMHYPFENEEKFDHNFPAKFIGEGIDQTRAWFYYLHVLGTAIMDRPAFQNVVVNGIVLAEDGKKMSKKLQNYPDPTALMNQYGADALRYYLITSPVVEAENLNFAEAGVKEVYQKNILLLQNVLAFYQLYATPETKLEPATTHVLDRWVVARLHQLVATVTTEFEAYELVRASRPIQAFINDLSTWYVRRSRDRFRDGDTAGVQTLGYILHELSKVIAPIMPFLADHLYLAVGGKLDSVHLESWPDGHDIVADEKLITEMNAAFQIVERGLALRMAAGQKIRQPLASFATPLAAAVSAELVAIICDELNIKSLQAGDEVLDTAITAELKLEGEARELIRQINQLRKDAGLTIADGVVLYQTGLDEVFAAHGAEILKATLASGVESGAIDAMKSVEGGAIGIRKS